MATIIDQFHDPTLATLVVLTKDRPEIVDLIKEAEVEPTDASNLPDSAFAWQERRAFPVHTREHTIMSRVYRENLPSIPSHVDTAIKEACEIFEIPDSIFARPKLAAVEESPDDFLLPDLKKLPVKNAEQVKTAESKLLDSFDKLTVEHRAMACRRLLDKAAEFDVKLHPSVVKLAGFTISSTEKLRSWLEARTVATQDGIYKTAFQKLADGLRNMPEEIHDRKQLLKLVDTIDELDKQAGLVKHYDRKLPSSLETVFNTTKVASDGVDLNGKFVPLTRLAAYDTDFYTDVLGEDFTREASDGRGGIDVHKLAMIIDTLPRDMKNNLARQIR